MHLLPLIRLVVTLVFFASESVMFSLKQPYRESFFSSKRGALNSREFLGLDYRVAVRRSEAIGCFIEEYFVTIMR